MLNIVSECPVRTQSKFAWCSISSGTSSPWGMLDLGSGSLCTNLLHETHWQACKKCLTDHVALVPTIDKLNTISMHCESRLCHDEERCLLVIQNGGAYKAELEAMLKVFEVVFKTLPESGPAPPTKAERRTMNVLKKLSGKK